MTHDGPVEIEVTKHEIENAMLLPGEYRHVGDRYYIRRGMLDGYDATPPESGRNKEAMPDTEKAAKYDEIQQRLWTAAKGTNGLQSAVAAALIRSLKIPGSNGEDPEDA